MGKMIDSPEAAFAGYLPRRDDLLLRLEAEAAEEGIPIVGPVVGQLLYLLARLKPAGRMFELGTANGYSAIWLGRACKENGSRLVSLEHDAAMARQAAVHLAAARLSPVVTVRCTDALAALADETEPVDFIFLDIEKKDYLPCLPDCTRLVPEGGLLVVDNTGFADAVDFNHAIAASARWQMVNLLGFLPGHSPNTDGVCIAMRC